MECFIVQYISDRPWLAFKIATLTKSNQNGRLYTRKRTKSNGYVEESICSFTDERDFKGLRTARQFHIRIKYAGDISPI